MRCCYEPCQTRVAHTPGPKRLQYSSMSEYDNAEPPSSWLDEFHFISIYSVHVRGKRQHASSSARSCHVLISDQPSSQSNDRSQANEARSALAACTRSPSFASQQIQESCKSHRATFPGRDGEATAISFPLILAIAPRYEMTLARPHSLVSWFPIFGLGHVTNILPPSHSFPPAVAIIPLNFLVISP